MPFVSVPRNIPARVYSGHAAIVPQTKEEERDAEYAQGYKDAVKQFLGQESWFALICELDGNPLLAVTITTEPQS